MSRATTLNIAIGIWVASSLLSLPNILHSTTKEEFYDNGDKRVICYILWPDSDDGVTASHDEYVYNVVILIVTYMIPMTSMAFTYFRVGRELWGSQSIGECTAKQIEAIKSKRKIVKMMIVVVVIFAVCWLPYHVYFLVMHHHPEINQSTYIQHVYLAIYWLAMSNSMYNPIIYCWMNSRFREGFKRVFCCLAFNDRETAQLRQHMAATRYSCSEPYADTRVTFNGTATAVPLHTLTETMSAGNLTAGPGSAAKFRGVGSDV
ncbi:hypothetical protein V5799_004746 [Amblyomma americanum]|uniref:G-protein coupled receptors family 1 profile domain-containing protein n=1 Tax=Amblyomma americanum TaxID=6943 RepID=A0AAQ4D582_AMBAM